NQATEEIKNACLDNMKTAATEGKTLEADLEKAGEELASVSKKGAVSAASGMIASLVGIVAGGACPSNVILGIGSLMSMMNEVDHSKEVKGRLEGLQKEFEARAKAMDKNSLEYQRMAFDFAIRGYEMMAQAYDEKASNYGNIKGIGATAVGIASMELIAASMGFPICSTSGSAIALAGGGVMMAMAGGLQGTSKSAAASHREKASKLRSLVEQWDTFHKNETQNAEDSRLAAQGGASGAGAKLSTSIGAAGGNSRGSQTTVKKASSNAIGTISNNTKRVNSCISKDGKPNSSCSCIAKNSCAESRPPVVNLVGTKQQKASLTKNLKSANKKLGVGKIFKNFNSLARGRQSLYDWSKRNKKLTNQRVKFASNMLKKYNSIREKKGFNPIKFDKNFISKHAKTSVSSAVDFSTSENDIREEDSLSTNLVKNITRYKKHGSWQKPVLFDVGVMYDEEVKEKLVAKTKLVDGAFISAGEKTNRAASKALDEKNLISRDKSLFGAISKRYLKEAKIQEWIYKED
ncbi:MAG: hypothetical protein ACJARO_001123, partial [Bacteriovoracaceae bacterium]